MTSLDHEEAAGPGADYKQGQEQEVEYRVVPVRA